jgi:hypothetical protein
LELYSTFIQQTLITQEPEVPDKYEQFPLGSLSGSLITSESLEVRISRLPKRQAAQKDLILGINYACYTSRNHVSQHKLSQENPTTSS